MLTPLSKTISNPISTNNENSELTRRVTNLERKLEQLSEMLLKNKISQLNDGTPNLRGLDDWE